MMSEARLNSLIRILLGAVVAGTVILIIAAARPLPRYAGLYIAELETPQPILNEWNAAAAYVSTTNPAVVSFPSNWNITDKVCMEIHYQRGNAPTALSFEDNFPEAHWDDSPSESLIIMPDDISARAPDESTFQIASASLFSQIELQLPFRVVGYDKTPILLSKDQSAARLLCYDFTGTGGARIPFTHVLRLSADNAHILHAPAVYFRYNTAPKPSDPPQAITLQKLDIETYLTKLQVDGASVVQPMTAEQAAQRATEAMLSGLAK